MITIFPAPIEQMHYNKLDKVSVN